MLKKSNFKDSFGRPEFAQGIGSRYRDLTSSDKSVKSKKKRNNSSDVVMVYHPSAKKGYPQLKGALAGMKNSSVPESSQQTGRKKRSNSQWGTHNKRPKSSKNISGGRKYKTANQNHNVSAENKLHSISHSIDHSTLLTNERPSSVVESLRYGKQSRKEKRVPYDIQKDSISTSIDVPSIELHNQDKSYKKMRHAPNNLIYQKAAELIAHNFHKNISKIPGKASSNSAKILRSTSRSGKNK